MPSSPWIQTYTGRAFYPLDPQPEDVVLEDIAHALSQLCRYGGHCLRFYSVAEHSVLVGKIIEDTVPRLTRSLRLAAILHDAAEAYLVDLPKPIKDAIGFEAYHAAEAKVSAAIFTRFGLDPRLASHPAIKSADMVALSSERLQLHREPPQSWGELPPPWPNIYSLGWAPRAAELAFLACARSLGIQ